MTRVAVSRVGTQVVVRMSGCVGDADDDPVLAAALGEVESLVSTRVVVDLLDVTSVGEPGVMFIRTLQDRWRVRLLNAPAGLLDRCRELRLDGDPGGGAQPPAGPR